MESPPYPPPGEIGIMGRGKKITQTAVNLMMDPPHLREMRLAARRRVLGASWDTIFEKKKTTDEAVGTERKKAGRAVEGPGKG